MCSLPQEAQSATAGPAEITQEVTPIHLCDSQAKLRVTGVNGNLRLMHFSTRLWRNIPIMLNEHFGLITAVNRTTTRALAGVMLPFVLRFHQRWTMERGPCDAGSAL